MNVEPLRASAIERALLGPAHASPELRRAAFDHDVGGMPDAVRALLDKVVEHAHRITDEDVAAAKGQVSEDELFELVVCAAYGVASRQLDRALRAIDEAG